MFLSLVSMREQVWRVFHQNLLWKSGLWGGIWRKRLHDVERTASFKCILCFSHSPSQSNLFMTDKGFLTKTGSSALPVCSAFHVSAFCYFNSCFLSFSWHASRDYQTVTTQYVFPQDIPEFVWEMCSGIPHCPHVGLIHHMAREQRHEGTEIQRMAKQTD